jgi:hypothetical protein
MGATSALLLRRLCEAQLIDTTQTWRDVVKWTTGETLAPAQAGAVRSAMLDCACAYQAIDNLTMRKAG